MIFDFFEIWNKPKWERDVCARDTTWTTMNAAFLVYPMCNACPGGSDLFCSKKTWPEKREYHSHSFQGATSKDNGKSCIFNQKQKYVMYWKNVCILSTLLTRFKRTSSLSLRLIVVWPYMASHEHTTAFSIFLTVQILSK